LNFFYSNCTGSTRFNETLNQNAEMHNDEKGVKKI
jgi:hypothetical protein